MREITALQGSSHVSNILSLGNFQMSMEDQADNIDDEENLQIDQSQNHDSESGPSSQIVASELDENDNDNDENDNDDNDENENDDNDDDDSLVHDNIGNLKGKQKLVESAQSNKNEFASMKADLEKMKQQMNKLSKFVFFFSFFLFPSFFHFIFFLFQNYNKSLWFNLESTPPSM